MSRWREFWNLLVGIFRVPFRPRIQLQREAALQIDFDWYNTFLPKDGVDYSQALKYAQEKYKEACEIFGSLDKKAEWLFGLGTAGSSAIYALVSAQYMNWIPATPSFVCMILAIISTIRARNPGERPTPMSIRGAIERTQDVKNPEAWLCASLHVAVRGMERVTAWKATQLTNASLAVVAAMLLLPLTLLFSLGDRQRPEKSAHHSSLGTSQEGAVGVVEGEVHLRFERGRQK